MAEAPIPQKWGGQTTQECWEVKQREWRTPPGLPRVPSLENDHSGTAKNAILRRSKKDAAGRDVVTVCAAAGLDQALVSQCSLVILRDSPTKNQEETNSKKFP